MFASQVEDYLDDDLLGTSRTHAQSNFNPDHPLYRRISQLALLTKEHRALRDGAHQHRYAARRAGVYAFSRVDARQQREYVVALNNSEQPKTAAVPTYVRRGSFVRVYGTGRQRLRSGVDRRLELTVPALSTVVYKATRTIPESLRAPRISLNRVRASAQANSRMRVHANVSGASFNEVTFYVKQGDGRWRSTGTDDTRPYRVFDDVSSLRAGTELAYRAVVRDNAGHVRASARRHAVVPEPRLTIEAPAEGADAFGTIEVRVTADPERATHVVDIQRRVDGRRWRTVHTDSSSPVYTYFDDLSAVPVGTVIRYRAILTEPDGCAAPCAPSRGRSHNHWSTAPPSPAACRASSAARRTGTPRARRPIWSSTAPTGSGKRPSRSRKGPTSTRWRSTARGTSTTGPAER
jgi:hypothetical protein